MPLIRILSQSINERLACVTDFLPKTSNPSPAAKKRLSEKQQPSVAKLSSYREDKL